MKHVTLTPREFQVARLIADGKTYEEIGHELAISPRTVEVHAAGIRRKLGARTNAAAISRAGARGLGARSAT